MQTPQWVPRWSHRCNSARKCSPSVNTLTWSTTEVPSHWQRFAQMDLPSAQWFSKRWVRGDSNDQPVPSGMRPIPPDSHRLHHLCVLERLQRTFASTEPALSPKPCSRCQKWATHNVPTPSCLALFVISVHVFRERLIVQKQRNRRMMGSWDTYPLHWLWPEAKISTKAARQLAKNSLTFNSGKSMECTISLSASCMLIWRKTTDQTVSLTLAGTL